MRIMKEYHADVAVIITLCASSRKKICLKMEMENKMTSERMKELNQEWRKACMPIYIKIFTLVTIFFIIMTIVAIIGAIITGGI